jgi:hypothetical protein
MMQHVVRTMFFTLALIIFEGMLVLVMGVKFCHGEKKKGNFFMRTVRQPTTRAPQKG